MIDEAHRLKKKRWRNTTKGTRKEQNQNQTQLPKPICHQNEESLNSNNAERKNKKEPL
jgi:hypothetical protein